MTETAGVVVNNSTWSLTTFFQTQGAMFFINVALGCVVLLRILVIIRVAKDSMARSNRLGSQIVGVLLVTFLTPIIGLPIYFALRPVGYKWDRLPWRQSAVMNLVMCANCSTFNPKDHEHCLFCGEHLKVKCKECSKTYPHSYGYCSHCGAPNIE